MHDDMKRILIQLDTDLRPSTFDRIVAVDADIDEVFSYGGVTPQNVEPLVHGAMFTRRPDDLKHTAIFIGGSQTAAGEALLTRITETFFGPLQVSVMMDSNGSNTTAAAAVLTAAQHVSFPDVEALVLGGTGPVGQRVAQLLASQGATVRVASRSLPRARSVCHVIAEAVPNAKLAPCAITSESGLAASRGEETWPEFGLEAACQGVAVIIAAGAAGVQFVSQSLRRSLSTLKVAIDLNAVPPAGLEGVEPADKAVERDGAVCYGAIGVGGTKMKIHKAALRRLFERNDLVLDTPAIYQLAEMVLSS